MVGKEQEADSQHGTFWNTKPSVPEFQNASAGQQIAVNPTGKMKDTLARKKSHTPSCNPKTEYSIKAYHKLMLQMTVESQKHYYYIT